MLDALLDGGSGKMLGQRRFREDWKFFIRREPQGYDLSHAQSRRQRLSGDHIMPKVFFGADGPVLRLQRERPYIPADEQQDHTDEADQRSGIKVFRRRLAQVEERPYHQCQHGQVGNNMVPEYITGMVAVGLFF